MGPKFMKMLKFYIKMTLPLFIFWGSAAAQESAAKPKERRATLNFEDELVEGSTQKPELFYLFQKKNFNYRRLIKLRENFLPEMRKTAEDVQRVRGGN